MTSADALGIDVGVYRRRLKDMRHLMDQTLKTRRRLAEVDKKIKELYEKLLKYDKECKDNIKKLGCSIKNSELLLLLRGMWEVEIRSTLLRREFN